MDEKKNSYVYPAVWKEDEGERYLEFVDFPGCVVDGGEKGDYINSAQDVLALTLIDYLDSGMEIPDPSEVDNAIYIHVWLPYFRSVTKVEYIKKTLTIPSWLDVLAKEANVNFSAALVKGIKEELGLE